MFVLLSPPRSLLTLLQTLSALAAEETMDASDDVDPSSSNGSVSYTSMFMLNSNDLPNYKLTSSESLNWTS